VDYDFSVSNGHRKGRERGGELRTPTRPEGGVVFCPLPGGKKKRRGKKRGEDDHAWGALTLRVVLFFLLGKKKEGGDLPKVLISQKKGSRSLNIPSNGAGWIDRPTPTTPHFPCSGEEGRIGACTNLSRPPSCTFEDWRKRESERSLGPGGTLHIVITGEKEGGKGERGKEVHLEWRDLGPMESPPALDDILGLSHAFASEEGEKQDALHTSKLKEGEPVPH